LSIPVQRTSAPTQCQVVPFTDNSSVVTLHLAIEECGSELLRFGVVADHFNPAYSPFADRAVGGVQSLANTSGSSSLIPAALLLTEAIGPIADPHHRSAVPALSRWSCQHGG
jgi:hypothetical protein